ncbi:MAG: SUMF1/EgtB/PvdO family nonheme iron enzyme, partial [bacterium]|nr:SUMF1/EgtB/PvdO family nonheme iron enzyme [bacterium]
MNWRHDNLQMIFRGILIWLLFSLLLISSGYAQIERELELLLYPERADSQQIELEPADSIAIDLLIDVAEMVEISAGNFIMGSDDHELDERPQRGVFVEKFWIDKYPVTNGQYAIFLNEFQKRFPDREADIAKFIRLGADGCGIIVREGQFFPVGSLQNHPVVYVSWHGADAYCKFYQKRLPTEAEWEKAVRGVNGNIFPWGDSIDGSLANYWDSGDPFDNGTTPVGFFNGREKNGFQTSDGRSPFGVYDLVDNVREWVADWYQWNYYSHSTRIDPRGPEKRVKKVVRGG